MHNIEKYKEIILAGAIGDAFGYLVEFDNLLEIERKYGSNGLTWNIFENYSDWRISDDTQMTFFCWDIVNKYINQKEINNEEFNKKMYHNFLEWRRTQFYREEEPQTTLGQNKELWLKEAPGITCLQALGSNKVGTIEKKINESKGCGGIMRVAPISFLNLPLEKIFRLGCDQAAITHGHENGYLSAGFFAGLLKELMNGVDFNQAIQNNIEVLKTYDLHENLLSYLHMVLEEINKSEILKGDGISEFIGDGWVGEEALGIAIYALAKSNSFEEVIELATNHQGDSDSTASLACQIYVAKNGLPQYIKEQTNKFKTINVFNYLADSLEKATAQDLTNKPKL